MSIDSDRRLIIVFLCLSNITITFNIGAVAAAIPLISRDFGLPDLDVAKVVSFYMVPYGIGALLYAPLSRFLTYRKILTVTTALYAVFSLLSGFACHLPQMLWAQVGAGIVAAGATPISLMAIGELFEKNVRGRLVGLYFGTSFFSSTVGMICMGMFSWRLLFFIPAIFGFITVLGFLFIKNHLLDRTHVASVNYLKAIVRSHIATVFIYIFIMSFLYHGLTKWFGVYLAHDYGLNKEVISFFLVVAAICGLSGQQIGGYLSDKKGRDVSCYFGTFILAASSMALVLHCSIFIVPIILGLVTVGWTISHNAISTVLTDASDDDRPIIASLNSSVRFFSGGLGFAASKFFVEKSFGLTFLGIGIIFLLMSGMIKHIMPQKS